MKLEDVFKGRMRYVAVLLAIAIIVGGTLVYLNMGSTPPMQYATVDDILNVHSERSGYQPDYVVASRDPWSNAVIATPAALYYEDGKDNATAVPLLVAGTDGGTQDKGVSKGITRFISAYGGESGALIGKLKDSDMNTLESAGAKFNWKASSPSPKYTSIAVAEQFWKRSDAALVIRNDVKGYSYGLNALPLACYLNIPVYVVDSIDSDVRASLSKLGVKYTLLCGDVGTYGRVYPLNNYSVIWSLIATGKDTGGKSVLKDRIGIDPHYIALANPMDVFPPKVEKSFTKTFNGTVKSQDTGSTSDPSLNPDAPKHYITIPADYEYANVKLETFMDFTQPVIPGHTPDDDGERSYTYFGIDKDKDGVMIDDGDSEDDCLEFFVPSLAYENIRTPAGISTKAHGYSEKPIFHATGEHCISILATLNLQPGDSLPVDPTPPPETTYEIRVTVEKLSSPNYPLLENASTLAPYLAAFRGGVVVAKPDFSIYSDDSILNSPRCGDTSANPKLLDDNNRKVFEVKTTIHSVLGDLCGINGKDVSALAERYSGGNGSMYLAIVGDTNMVPWYIYPTEGQIDQPQQGWGVGGDGAYSDIDMEFITKRTELKAAHYELAVGRLMGWDIQDLSALIARTAFYYDIIDSFEGHSGEWKNSAMTTFGSRVPVGTAKTVTEKLDMALQQAGFAVDSSHDVAMSHRKYSGPYWEKSNFIMFCAHGFYYWFVPPGYRPDGVGGGFDVAHVKDMNFGPGLVFGESCVTGKVDGIKPYNSIALTFLHSGMNVYVGASRLSWGTLAMNPASESNEEFGAYLGLLYYGYLTGYLYNKQGGLISEGDGDHTVGEAFMLAKNKFYEMQGSDQGGANDDTMEEFNLFGDPAFNPYEPNHNG